MYVGLLTGEAEEKKLEWFGQSNVRIVFIFVWFDEWNAWLIYFCNIDSMRNSTIVRNRNGSNKSDYKIVSWQWTYSDNSGQTNDCYGSVWNIK